MPLDPAFAFCGEGDARLAGVAAKLAEREARGLPRYDGEELEFALRAEGEPHVWPHSWTLSGASLDERDVRERLEKWLGTFTDSGARRCGIARAKIDGKIAIGVVAIDALADLRALPTRARVGQWLRVEANVRVPIDGAKLVVLGPHGAPRTVPTTVRGQTVTATFAPDVPGIFHAQLLGFLEDGPRPLLEAVVFADVPPSDGFAEEAAPGEDAAKGAPNDTEALRRMLDSARRSESLGPLERSDELDRIALGHAARMQTTGRLAHDAGDGEPSARLREAGISVRRFGENVAHASSVTRAHRVLWASPSHRSNVLDPAFNAVGVGVVRDGDSTWICELFADFTAGGTGPGVGP